MRLFPYCFSLPGQHGRRCTISACCPNPPRPYNRPRRRGRLRIGADCKDARRIEGRGKEASGGSFARTTGKRAENEERLGDGGIKTCDCLYRSDLFKRVSIATTRASISFPGRTRSIETKPLATDASRQAAHSNAEPRASSKNLTTRETILFGLKPSETENIPNSSLSARSTRCSWRGRLGNRASRLWGFLPAARVPDRPYSRLGVGAVCGWTKDKGTKQAARVSLVQDHGPHLNCGAQLRLAWTQSAI